MFPSPARLVHLHLNLHYPFFIGMKYNAKNSDRGEEKTILTQEIHHGIVELVPLDLIHQWTTNQVACLLKTPTHTNHYLIAVSRITIYVTVKSHRVIAQFYGPSFCISCFTETKPLIIYVSLVSSL